MNARKRRERKSHKADTPIAAPFPCSLTPPSHHVPLPCQQPTSSRAPSSPASPPPSPLPGVMPDPCACWPMCSQLTTHQILTRSPSLARPRASRARARSPCPTSSPCWHDTHPTKSDIPFPLLSFFPSFPFPLNPPHPLPSCPCHMGVIRRMRPCRPGLQTSQVRALWLPALLTVPGIWDTLLTCMFLSFGREKAPRMISIKLLVVVPFHSFLTLCHTYSSEHARERARVCVLASLRPLSLARYPFLKSGHWVPNPPILISMFGTRSDLLTPQLLQISETFAPRCPFQ